jgi:Fe-S cluster assembly protein SufD
MSTQEYQDQFRAFMRGAGASPSWAVALRERAIERFAALGFPTPRIEDWHFTSVAPLAESRFQALARPSGDVARSQVAPYLFDAGPTLVFVNGRFSADLSTLGGLADGVRVMEVARALTDSSLGLDARLGSLASIDRNAFTALNTAFAVDGAMIHIGANVESDQPIQLLFVADSSAARGMVSPRIVIVADHHSRATVIESYVGLGQATYFTNAVSEVWVGEGATLSHFKVQRESERAFHVQTIQVEQARDSHYVSFSFATGAALSRTNVYTRLGDTGCGSTLNGLYMVDGDQHVDHQTSIEHAAPNCFSREIYKGIIDGSAHGVFNGKVYVHPIAQKTDGKQTNNNLLLSERARVDTKPQLEIFADDVKCTHGATVGRLD